MKKIYHLKQYQDVILSNYGTENCYLTEERELRLLHHLKREDIFPDDFQKMHVGAAIRFFSMQTVAAIQVAVKLQNILPENALSTAAFIKLVY